MADIFTQEPTTPATRPQCCHMFVQGARKGQKCSNVVAKDNPQYCSSHKPKAPPPPRDSIPEEEEEEDDEEKEETEEETQEETDEEEQEEDGDEQGDEIEFLSNLFDGMKEAYRQPSLKDNRKILKYLIESFQEKYSFLF